MGQALFFIMKINIVFGTVGGNTKLVCERVAEVFESKGLHANLFNARLVVLEDALDCDLLVLACPTYGIGELEQHFEVFLKKLHEVEIKGRKCAIIGLGDPKYDKDYHLESTKIIMDFLQKKEGEILYMPLRISRNPLPLIEQGFVDRWAEKISEIILQ